MFTQALASKYGLISITENADLTSPPTLERNVDPWKRKEAARNWDELRTVFGYAPWDVLAAGGNFIPASLAQRLKEKAVSQDVPPVPTNADKKKSAKTTTSLSQKASSESKADAAACKGPASESSGAADRSSGSKDKFQGGAICADAQTPSKTADRRHAGGSGSSQVTPVSASRLRRGAPALSAPENADVDEEETRMSRSDVHLGRSRTSIGMDLQRQSPPSDTRAKTPLQAQSPISVRTSSESKTHEDPAASTNLESGKSCTDNNEGESSTSVKATTVSGLITEKSRSEVLVQPGMDVEKHCKPDIPKPCPAAAIRPPKRGKKSSTGCKFSRDGPRQMKLTDLLRFTLNKVKGKVAITIRPEATRAAEFGDDESDEDFTLKRSRTKRRLVDDEPDLAEDAPQKKLQESQNHHDSTGVGSTPSHTQATDSNVSSRVGGNEEPGPAVDSTHTDSGTQELTQEDEARRQEKKRQREQRKMEKLAAMKKQKRLERKR